MEKMEAVKVDDYFLPGVTREQVNQFLERCGSDYRHFDNEQYPMPKGGGMRERIIAIHKDAKVYYSNNVELGRCFAFSEEEADDYFRKLELELYEECYSSKKEHQKRLMICKSWDSDWEKVN